MNWIVYSLIFIVSLLVYFKSKFEGKTILITSSLLFITFLSWQSGISVLALTGLTYLSQKSKILSWLTILIHLTVMLVGAIFLEQFLLFKIGLLFYGLQNVGILLTTIRKSPQEFTFQQIAFANVFFTKFTSGPILLPKEITALETNQNFNTSNFYYGINRIVFGLFKVFALADNLSIITDTVFGHPESEFKAITIAFASILFTFEMYLNFSGYTDIALGFSKLFNISLKENFR